MVCEYYGRMRNVHYLQSFVPNHSCLFSFDHDPGAIVFFHGDDESDQGSQEGLSLNVPQFKDDGTASKN